MVMPWLAAIALCAFASPSRHPMHTSAAEVREISGRVIVQIRIFPDDLGAVVPGAAEPGADSAVAGYVQRTFVIAGRDGHPVPLRWGGMERVGDVLQLHLESASGASLSGAAIRHGLLLERFPDQVNVVRATYAGQAVTLLFLPGDAAKHLP
jgi:hypothetical protein